MRSGKNNRRLIVGLTGGMGSGKSTVLGMLRSKGAFVLDADAVVHELLAGDRKILSAIKKEFGAEVFSGGKLNRRELARKAFASREKRKKLEKILHPRVREIIFKRLKRHRRGVAVVDVPLLYEAGWRGSFDKVIVANASLANRVKRLAAKGFDRGDIERRIRSQGSLAAKVRKADFVVNNNGSKTQTLKQIERLWKKLPVAIDGGM